MANLQEEGFWQQYDNLILILSGILIGTLISVVIPNFGTIIKPIGDIFPNLLFTIVVPLVSMSIASAMGNMTNMKHLGKILGGTIGTFTFTGAIAGVCVLVRVNLFNPSADTTIELVASEMGEAQTADELLVSSLTVSDFSSLWDKSNMLPFIIFAILFGFCAFAYGGEQSPMSRLLANLDDAIMKFVGIIMLVAPVGLGTYFTNLMATYGPGIIGDYGRSMLVCYPLYAFYRMIFFPLYAFLADGRRNVTAMVKNILRPAVTTFTAQFSAATVPVNKEACDSVGMPKDISDLVLSMGCAIRMDGSVLSSITRIALLYGVLGMNFSGAGTYGMAIVVAILSTFILSGAPGDGLVGEMLIISTFNLPAEVFPIIATLGFLLDLAITCLNASGDTIAFMLVTRLMGGRE